MNIRPETAKDFKSIYDLVRRAFETAKVSNGQEQDFVEKLRSGENYLPELALVAEDEGRLAGHIMLTKITVEQEPENWAALLAAPLSVELEHRGQGLGAELMREAVRRAAAKNFPAVFLVGDPAYYRRFGFKPVTEYGLTYNLEIPSEYVLGLELREKALQEAGGRINLG